MRLEIRDAWAAPPGAPAPVLRGVSLGLRGGDWVAIRGENGCGKSTLAQVAAGLLVPLRGERVLTFDGAGPPDADGSVPGGRTGARPGPRVTTVLQDPSVQLFAPTVAEEIELTALHLGESAEWRAIRLERWARTFGLEADLSRSPSTLSAGRQQLVLLAAALAAEPDLLVADEACAHLDARTRRRVLDALGEETRRGLAIVWVTQDPEEWGAASHRIDLGDPADRVGVPPATASAGAMAVETPGPGGGSAVVLEVAPCPANPSGPCVRVEEPLRLDLPSRGMVCLEGPNGAGKSVLLGSSCGLVDTPQVRVTRAGHRFPPLYVGQYPETQLFEDEVGRELAYAAVSRGLSREDALSRARACLGRLGLADRLPPGRHSWELSTGERRLLLLVAALIAPADLLALDEPTAGLDSFRRAALAGLVTERSRKSLVLIASQDMGWVDALPCSRVVIGGPGTLSSPSKKTD